MCIYAIYVRKTVLINWVLFIAGMMCYDLWNRSFSFGKVNLQYPHDRTKKRDKSHRPVYVFVRHLNLANANIGDIALYEIYRVQ